MNRNLPNSPIKLNDTIVFEGSGERVRSDVCYYDGDPFSDGATVCMEGTKHKCVVGYYSTYWDDTQEECEA